MGVMGGIQHSRLVVSLLALALGVAAGFLPAAAQSGAAAVVCVGSETPTLTTNPVRRVSTEDMEVVYRTGADIGQRTRTEHTLSSEFGSYPEVWCAWSDPRDDHAVIIGYTGVIRQDLTVTPENSRFRAFSAIRRVYTEAMEIVYRSDVGIGECERWRVHCNGRNLPNRGDLAVGISGQTGQLTRG